MLDAGTESLPRCPSPHALQPADECKSHKPREPEADDSGGPHRACGRHYGMNGRLDYS
jgi:hypothetical protein